MIAERGSVSILNFNEIEFEGGLRFPIVSLKEKPNRTLVTFKHESSIKVMEVKSDQLRLNVSLPYEIMVSIQE